LEFGTFQIPQLDTDKETILLLSGDIHVKTGIIKKDWIKNVSAQFAHVLIVFGNHEHYRSSFDRSVPKLREALALLQLTNVTILDNEAFMIPDTNIKVIGGTMWTDFNKGDPITLYSAANGGDALADFKYIRDQNHLVKFRPSTAMRAHQTFKTFLREELAVEHDGPIILMTHHAPHQLSISSFYKDKFHQNGAYASDLSEIILDNPKIKLWFHGHMHNSSDYPIGDDCRVICNPRGYYPEELNRHFNPNLLIALDGL
jgi:hypothetical protein